MSFSSLVMLWWYQTEPDTINRLGLKVKDHDLEMFVCLCVPTLCDVIAGQDLLQKKETLDVCVCVRMCACACAYMLGILLITTTYTGKFN